MSISTLKNKPVILVVDDQENWRLAVTRLLETSYKVQTVSNLQAAEEAINRSRFDVVILDIRLIDEDVFNVGGLSLLKKLKTENPKTKVIILTGYPDSIRREILDTYAADALMYKAPDGKKFDVAGFRKIISELISQPGK